MDRIKARHNINVEQTYKAGKHLQYVPVDAATFVPLPAEEGRPLRDKTAEELFTKWLHKCEARLDRKVVLGEPLQQPGAAGQDKRAAVKLWGRRFIKYS